MTHVHTIQRKTRSHHEEGNILVTALLMLVVINLLAMGLVLASVRESNIATYKTVDSVTFHVSESCAKQAIAWLEDQATVPADEDLPYVITALNLDDILTGEEDEDSLNRINGYSYNCTVTYVLTKADGTGGGESSGEGGDISESAGYGAAGDTSPKYYYQIEAVGQGPGNAVKRMYTLVSVQY
ncbi:MAG: hypothetical protein K0R63_1630 [Rickettsiales bacterium]|jgi:Tfp pilus assembly protein PilX|nr:hypothetical protein [Rickettsiales bacterium]